MKKHHWLLSCIVFAVIVLIGLGVILASRNKEPAESSNEMDAKIIRDNHMDVMLYGEEIDLNTAVIRFRKLNSISSETLKGPDGTRFSYLVINDLDGSITLSEDEIKIVDDYLQTPGVGLLYLGKKYLTAWNQPEWGPVASLDNTVELSAEYTNEKGHISRGIGTWTETDMNIGDMKDLGERIVIQMRMLIYLNQ